MNIEDCKEGVRVYWGGGEYDSDDSGAIVSKNGSIWTNTTCHAVWVEWDSNGKIAWVDRHELELEQPKEESKMESSSITSGIAVNANVTVQLGKDMTVWINGADELFVLVKGHTQPYRMKADSNGLGLHVSVKDMQIKDYDGCKGVVLK